MSRLACKLLVCGGMFLAIGMALIPETWAADDLNAQERRLMPLAKQEGAVTIINPLFSDETAATLHVACGTSNPNRSR